VAHSVRRAQLREHDGVRGRFAEVAHPELGGLEVGRVDHKLLRGRSSGVNKVFGMLLRQYRNLCASQCGYEFSSKSEYMLYIWKVCPWKVAWIL